MTAPAKAKPKSEETSLRILDAALELFREDGFDKAKQGGMAGP